MTIPTWHIDTVVAHELPGADDHIFENFVESGAQMNMTIGIGRTVMEHITWPVFTHLPELGVQIQLFPLLHNDRLSFRQVGLHGKIRSRQIEGFLIVHSSLQGCLISHCE